MDDVRDDMFVLINVSEGIFVCYSVKELISNEMLVYVVVNKFLNVNNFFFDVMFVEEDLLLS